MDGFAIAVVLFTVLIWLSEDDDIAIVMMMKQTILVVSRYK
jgi:hypothetical protein